LKNTLLYIFSFFILFTSCKKEEEGYKPDYRYGPGPFVFRPFIRADVDGVLMPADYGYPYYGFYSNKYDTRDSTLYVSRWVNTTGRDQYILIKGFKMDLEQMTYPITFWPSSTTSYNYRKMELSLKRNKGYETSQSDSTLFSITLTGYSNKELSGNFQGLLINSLDSDTVHITNGVFNVTLELW
jgi:hypothetical protein